MGDTSEDSGDITTTLLLFRGFSSLSSVCGDRQSAPSGISCRASAGGGGATGEDDELDGERGSATWPEACNLSTISEISPPCRVFLLDVGKASGDTSFAASRAGSSLLIKTLPSLEVTPPRPALLSMAGGVLLASIVD
jgi:hypothetical protein